MTHPQPPNNSKLRLEQTRQAIVAHIQEKKERHTTVRDRLRKAFTPNRSGHHGTPMDVETKLLWRQRLSRLTDAVRDYWQDHPLHLALELAGPGLSGYAQRRPVSFLAISAAAGALIVLARPWRRLTVAGLVIATLRSQRISGVLRSAVYGDPRIHPPH